MFKTESGLEYGPENDFVDDNHKEAIELLTAIDSILEGKRSTIVMDVILNLMTDLISKLMESGATPEAIDKLLFQVKEASSLKIQIDSGSDPESLMKKN